MADLAAPSRARARDLKAPLGARRCEVVSVSSSGSYHVFTARDESGVTPEPGQFYMLMAERDWGAAAGRPYLPRAFSFAAAQQVAGGIELGFLADVVGPGTARLVALEPGEGLRVTGPLGRGFSPPLELNAGAAGAILVGGGIGVAPLAALRRQLRDRGIAATTLLGFRGTAHHGGLELFSGATSLCPGVQVAMEDGSRGHRGYVTDLLETMLAGDDAASAAVYACGPPAMLEAVRRLCNERGVAAELALEAPMACGFGACMGCAVARAGGGYMRLCVDGPVVNAAAIDTALIPGAGH